MYNFQTIKEIICRTKRKTQSNKAEMGWEATRKDGKK